MHSAPVLFLYSLFHLWLLLATDMKKQQGRITYSKRHNKFLLPVLAKAIYENFCKTGSEISNTVNYKLILSLLFFFKI